MPKYTLTIKTAEDKIVRYGGRECVYDHESFEALAKHLKELEALGVIADTAGNWRFHNEEASDRNHNRCCFIGNCFYKLPRYNAKH